MKKLAKSEIKVDMFVISISRNPVIGRVVKVGAERHKPEKALVDIITPAGLFKSVLLKDIGLFETEFKWKQRKKKQIEIVVKPRFVRRKK